MKVGINSFLLGSTVYRRRVYDPTVTSDVPVLEHRSFGRRVVGQRVSTRKVLVPSGTRFSDLAREELGSDMLWWRIADLNPNVDPTLPIPVGTEVLLP